MPVTTGNRIGPYELVAPLGSGWMGEVWKARDTRLNRLVALKILPAGTANDDDRRRRSHRGAGGICPQSSDIVTIHDIVSEHGHEAIAMEFIPRRTLDALIQPQGIGLLRDGRMVRTGPASPLRQVSAASRCAWC